MTVIIIIWLLAIVVANVILAKKNPKPSVYVREIATAGQQYIYVEVRKWKIWWGLVFNAERAVNLLLKDWEERGYKCVQCIPSTSAGFNIFKIIVALVESIITLGTISIWKDYTFLFEREGTR
jgi:hypothetical protein